MHVEIVQVRFHQGFGVAGIGGEREALAGSCVQFRVEAAGENRHSLHQSREQAVPVLAGARSGVARRYQVDRVTIVHQPLALPVDQDRLLRAGGANRMDEFLRTSGPACVQLKNQIGVVAQEGGALTPKRGIGGGGRENHRQLQGIRAPDRVSEGLQVFRIGGIIREAQRDVDGIHIPALPDGAEHSRGIRAESQRSFRAARSKLRQSSTANEEGMAGAIHQAIAFHVDRPLRHGSECLGAG